MNFCLTQNPDLLLNLGFKCEDIFRSTSYIFWCLSCQIPTTKIGYFWIKEIYEFHSSQKSRGYIRRSTSPYSFKIIWGGMFIFTETQKNCLTVTERDVQYLMRWMKYVSIINYDFEIWDFKSIYNDPFKWPLFVCGLGNARYTDGPGRILRHIEEMFYKIFMMHRSGWNSSQVTPPWFKTMRKNWKVLTNKEYP